MITLCPSPSDNHAPFAHRLVKPKTTVVIGHGKERQIQVMPMPPVFVICAICDHWIKRKVAKCNCPVDCHNE